MVSNDKIKQLLLDKREGKNIKGYLVCDACHGSYELQPGEKPEDFSSKCECGGRLIHTKNISNPNNNENKKIKKILIYGTILVAAVIIIGMFIFTLIIIGYLGISAQANHITNDAGQGSYYDQLAIVQTQYNNISTELSNLQTKADSPNNKNLFTTYMNVELQQIKTQDAINSAQIALASGQSTSVVQSKINAANAQLKAENNSLSTLQHML